MSTAKGPRIRLILSAVHMLKHRSTYFSLSGYMVYNSLMICSGDIRVRWCSRVQVCKFLGPNAHVPRDLL